MAPRFVFLTSTLIIAGCGGEDRTSAAADFDPASARTTLTDALDAWKKGEAKGLARRKPPIRFADDDLASGLRLTDYAIAEPDAPIEANRDVLVTLSLRDAKGKSVRREARYQVATAPSLVVLRSDQ